MPLMAAEMMEARTALLRAALEVEDDLREIAYMAKDPHEVDSADCDCGSLGYHMKRGIAAGLLRAAILLTQQWGLPPIKVWVIRSTAFEGPHRGCRLVATYLTHADAEVDGQKSEWAPLYAVEEVEI